MKLALQQTVTLGDPPREWHARLYWDAEEGTGLIPEARVEIARMPDSDPVARLRINQAGDTQVTIDHVVVRDARSLDALLHAVYSAHTLVRDAMGGAAGEAKNVEEHRGAPTIVVVSR